VVLILWVVLIASANSPDTLNTLLYGEAAISIAKDARPCRGLIFSLRGISRLIRALLLTAASMLAVISILINLSVLMVTSLRAALLTWIKRLR